MPTTYAHYKLGEKVTEALATSAKETILANRELFDIVTARAVAELSILCELCLPFLKVGGKAVFYKQKSEEELSGGKNAVKELGGKIVSINDYTLFSTPENVRNIIVIEKVKSTPEKYPREYKQMLKKKL